MKTINQTYFQYKFLLPSYVKLNFLETSYVYSMECYFQHSAPTQPNIHIFHVTYAYRDEQDYESQIVGMYRVISQD